MTALQSTEDMLAKAEWAQHHAYFAVENAKLQLADLVAIHAAAQLYTLECAEQYHLAQSQ